MYFSRPVPPVQRPLPLSTSSYAYRQAHKNVMRNSVELSVNERQNENRLNDYQKRQEERRAVLNPSEMYSNSQNVMDTDAFYRTMSPRHQENSSSDEDDDETTVRQNTRPTVHEVSNRGQSSSSSRPIQKKKSQSKKRAPKRRVDAFVNDPRFRDFYSIDYMDTKEVTQALWFKINELKLSQSKIAEKILERSQGTLSDILSQPKPWEKLKSGHDTYRRMYMFLKLSNQEMKRVMEMSVDDVQEMMNFPPTTTKVQKNEKEANESPKEKRGRTVISDVQKQTLEAVYMEYSRPNKELIQSISHHLDLTPYTVRTWFMNARRRAKAAQYNTPATPSNGTHYSPY